MEGALPASPKRHIVIRLPHFIAVPTLLRCTDYVTTAPSYVMRALDDVENIRALPLPFSVPSLSIALYWHERFHRDAGHRWLAKRLPDSSPTSLPQPAAHGYASGDALPRVSGDSHAAPLCDRAHQSTRPIRSPLPTPLASFGYGNGPASVTEARARFENTNTPMAAYLDLARREQAEIVTPVAAESWPSNKTSGRISKPCCNHWRRRCGQAATR